MPCVNVWVACLYRRNNFYYLNLEKSSDSLLAPWVWHGAFSKHCKARSKNRNSRLLNNSPFPAEGLVLGSETVHKKLNSLSLHSFFTGTLLDLKPHCLNTECMYMGGRGRTSVNLWANPSHSLTKIWLPVCLSSTMGSTIRILVWLLSHRKLKKEACPWCPCFA